MSADDTFVQSLSDAQMDHEAALVMSAGRDDFGALFSSLDDAEFATSLIKAHHEVAGATMTTWLILTFLAAIVGALIWLTEHKDKS